MTKASSMLETVEQALILAYGTRGGVDLQARVAIAHLSHPTDEMIWASCEYTRRQITGSKRAVCSHCESGAELKQVCAEVAREHIEAVIDAALVTVTT